MIIIIDIINYLLVIAVLFFVVRIAIARIRGRKLAELKPLLYCFCTNLALVLIIHVFTNVSDVFTGVIDAITYLAAIAIVFFAYKIVIARIGGKKFAELKPLLYSLGTSLALVWIINIFTGFIK